MVEDVINLHYSHVIVKRLNIAGKPHLQLHNHPESIYSGS